MNADNYFFVIGVDRRSSAANILSFTFPNRLHGTSSFPRRQRRRLRNRRLS
jgi:hypothetical protein